MFIVALGAMLLVPIVVMVLFSLRAPPRPGPRPSASSAPASADASIAGRVLDDGGAPVAHARVRVVSVAAPTTPLRTLSSSEDGSFEATGVPPGVVRLLAEDESAGVASTADIALVAAEARSGVVIVLGRAPAVLGVVTSTTGAVVAGATVSLEGTEAWLARTATTDAEGRYRLPMVAADATAVVAVARGYERARAALARAPGERRVDLRLAALAPPVGVVLDPSGKPVAGALVSACAGQEDSARATTDEAGKFTLPAAAAGCIAVAQHGAYAPSDAVVLEQGRALTLHLRAGGSIDGTVVDEHGDPLASTVVIESFRSASVDPAFRGARGDERAAGAGAFRFDSLAPGTYVLSALAPGRPSARSSAVDVVAGRAAETRIVVPMGSVLEGRVVDEATHAPIAHARIALDASFGKRGPGLEGAADDRGEFRLEGVPSGPFSIRVEQAGYRTRLVTGIHTSGQRVVRRDVSLHPLDQGRASQFEFAGIGASLARGDRGVRLADVVDGAPAAQAGLRAGDTVVRIDGEAADDMPVPEVAERLRGEQGSDVSVTIERPGAGELSFTVRRAMIVR